MPAGVETTPTDPLTGLPYPVLMKSADFYLRRADYHHMLHPEKSPELGYDEDGQKLTKEDPLRVEGAAARYCMGEYLPRWLHDRYHDIFFGPKLPDNTHDKFVTAVLACAGVVPRKAIYLYTAGSWKPVSLSNKQHDFIRRRVFYEGADSLSSRKSRANDIGKFFANYIIGQTLPEVANEAEVQQKIKEFLEPTSREQWEKAGSFILGFAAQASVHDVAELYRDAKNEGMVAEKHKARRLGDIILKYFKKERFPDYFPALEERARLVAA